MYGPSHLPCHLRDLLTLYTEKKAKGATTSQLSSLVGAIGEVWVVINKGMIPAPPGVSDLDGWIESERVQVKTIGPDRTSTASHVTEYADRLIYLWLRDASGAINVIYDGSTALVIAAAKQRAKKHVEGHDGGYQFDAWTMQDVPGADQRLASELREKFKAGERERKLRSR